jgi:hypothetical protein
MKIGYVKSLPVRCLFGFGAPPRHTPPSAGQLSKLASPLPSLDCCAAGTLSVSFILPPCNLTLVSLSPPRPRSHRLLRRLSAVSAPSQRRARYANHVFSETSYSPWLQLPSPQNKKKPSVKILSHKPSMRTVIAFRRISVASSRT